MTPDQFLIHSKFEIGGIQGTNLTMATSLYGDNMIDSTL
jgi:hypothetical protein